jgi:hypothetical protein
MNSVQLHLILTHFPIVGFIASFALLLYALWRGSREIRTVALAGIALSGLIILPVLASGNAAEEFVERLPGIAESLVEHHEAAADTAGALALLAGAAALVTLVVQRWAPRFASAGLAVVALLVVVATAGVGWTAHLGGQIRHPEVAVAWNERTLPTGDGAAALLGTRDRTPAGMALGSSEQGRRGKHDDEDDEQDDD